MGVKMIYDADTGECKSEIDIKVAKLKADAKSFLDMLLTEKTINEKRKKPLIFKWGYRLSAKLNQLMRQYGVMAACEQEEIDYETIRDYFAAYTEIVSHYNMYFDFPATKQDFCALMCITVKTFNKWATSPDENIRQIKESIDDYLNGLGFQSAEAGNLNDRAVMSRMKIKSEGQGMVENSIDIKVTVEQKFTETPAELERRATRLLESIEEKHKK